MKFLWTTIHVKDLDRSIAFYRDLLDLQVQSRITAGELDIAFLGYGHAGEALLELIASAGKVTYSDSVSIGFQVESVEAMLPILKEKKIALTGGPFVGPDHVFVFIRDPDGMQVQLFERKK